MEDKKNEQPQRGRLQLDADVIEDLEVSAPTVFGGRRAPGKRGMA